MEKKPDAIDLILPAIPEMELTAAKTAEAVSAFMRLDADRIDEIKAALVEACINATEHSKSADSRVNIKFEVADDQLIIKITDQGAGFDVHKVREELDNRHQAGGEETRLGVENY